MIALPLPCSHDDTMHIDRDLVLPTSRKPWK
jgi:hypothetical protein